MKIFTAQQMRDFDRAAMEEYGVPSIVLMENAALRVVEFLEHKFAPLHGKKVVVLCGKGNNGGDGFAIARHLANAGCAVHVLMAAPSDELQGDALTNYQMLQRVGLGWTDITEDSPDLGLGSGDEPGLEYWAEYGDIVLDALLGTGFRGELHDESLRRALQVLREARGVRIAVDVPSALNSDSGEAAHEAVAVDYTITLAAPKRGLFLRDGVRLAGEIWIGDIGVPHFQLWSTQTGCRCITRHFAGSLLPNRPLDAHKGDAGRALICGGSFGMSGAPSLAARAALRAGVGLCIACLPDKVMPVFAAACLEATSHALPCDDAGHLIAAAADLLPDLWKNVNAVALGPGLSRAEGALDFARRVVRDCPHPLIVDADALYALRAIEAEVKARPAATVLTPHPGEMGELMQMETSEVQNDRLGIAAACAAKFNAIVVLKGARSIVALPDGRTFINLTGNPGMATGGSGDVLTGIIAGLLAQLKDAEAATLLGVHLHGLAGDVVYREEGNGLVAGDIIEALPFAVRELKNVPEAVNARLQPLH